MNLLNEESRQQEREEAPTCSRRSILKGSAALLVGGLAGGIAGCAASARSASEARIAQAPPPLPWKWTQLDPNEAGRRAYQNYLKNKG